MTLFIAVLVTRVKEWKPPKGPSADKWLCGVGISIQERRKF
jgi:hypothetical protein